MEGTFCTVTASFDAGQHLCGERFNLGPNYNMIRRIAV